MVIGFCGVLWFLSRLFGYGIANLVREEYVDAKMAEYRMQQSEIATGTVTKAPSHGIQVGELDAVDEPSTGNPPRIASADKQSVTAGKLMEVDLSGRPPKEEPPKKAPRIRLGRDGKPWRPRRRNRRNSEDQARDALVDSIMKENSGTSTCPSTPPFPSTS